MIQEFFPVLDAVPFGDIWGLLFRGLLCMIVWMFLLWLWQRRIENAGVVDFGWAAGLAFLGAYYAMKADGYGPRRFLVATMALIWGGRLALHLLFDRILGKPEDARYVTLRESWVTRLGAKFFLFFQFQGILVVFLSVPFVLLATDPYPRLSGVEVLGFLLWLVALGGEWVADAQLKRFKADPENQGKTCQSGLWYYSRHPNYFFEWLIWVAYFICSLNVEFGWITLYCPLLMLFFLLRVTGIPAAEAQSLKTRGDAYRSYQESTSMFIPWPKKSMEETE